MQSLQATWMGPSSIALWSASGSLADALAEDLPEAASLGQVTELSLAVPGEPLKRRKVAARQVAVADLLPLLPALATDDGLSDTLRVWSMAARLGLELAARQAVVPTATPGEAHWRVVLSRPADRRRFSEVVAALPLAARLIPTRERGTARVLTADMAVHAFLDAIADKLYRQGAWPGPARGWTLELADALRGEATAFHPRDARFHSVPDQLAAWSRDETASVRLGVTLLAPVHENDKFKLRFSLHPSDTPEPRIPLDVAWAAGARLVWEGTVVEHPAWHAMKGLARAQRIHPPLAAALVGDTPRDITLEPAEAFLFWSEARPALRDAGLHVEVPESFRNDGSRRLRVRMRLLAQGTGISLSEAITWRWEVVLGERVLAATEVKQLRATNERVVQFRGEWILVDPADLARLPQNDKLEGKLDAATALRAILTGQHEGVPVVADDKLNFMVEALRHPPIRAVPRHLNASLRPYQQRGFAWLGTLADLGLGACLADDMGLGKTVQVIAHLLDRKARWKNRPSLVVCPTSLLGNWTRELSRFAPTLRVARHHGFHRDLDRAIVSDVVLTTYGLLARDAEALSKVSWNVVVLDEAQAIKNPDSQRARAASQLPAAHHVAMTGTPIENRLDELWSLFHFVLPGLLGPRATFRRTVAIPVEKLGDGEVAKRLRLGTSPFLLRRLKTDPDVAPDLPDKVERREHCSMSSEAAALYRRVAEDHLARIAETTAFERRGQVLAMLTALKQVCNHPAHYLKDGNITIRRSGKLARCIEILDAVMAIGERAIVFTQYREMGDILAAVFERHFHFRVPFLHGAVPVGDRDEMVRRFQEDRRAPPLLLVSLRAGGVGLNLTRATHVLHYDRWWNPAVEDQATDRAYRIGQRRNVQVYKLVCQATLEERIDAMLDEKRGLAETVVGSGERVVTELDDAALRALVALGDDAVLEEE